MKSLPVAKSFLILTLFSLLLSNSSKAEVNLVPEGQRVMLASSQDVASLHLDNALVHQLVLTNATALCSKLNKNFIRLTPTQITNEELLKIEQEKVFQASKAIFDQSGVVFEPGTFPLFQYSQPVEIPTSRKIETACYWSAGIFVGVGGFLTFMMAFPIEGEMDPKATLITGCIAGGGAVVSAIGGGIARLYRKLSTTQAPDADIENQVASAPVFALPSLVNEIWCE